MENEGYYTGIRIRMGEEREPIVYHLGPYGSLLDLLDKIKEMRINFRRRPKTSHTSYV